MSAQPQSLVDPDWLESRLGDPTVRIIALAWTDRQRFDDGHIPGAIFWNWKDMLWDPLTRDFPDPQSFADRCGAAGIGNETTVVFYGDPAIQFGFYAWWVFKYCGHKDVRVLNGSRMRWEREGRPLSVEIAAVTPAVYVPNTQPDDASMRVRRDTVLSALHRSDIVILDHRSPEEYRGELYSPPGSPNHGAERLGHIPGARHLYFEDLVGEDGSIKPVEEMRAMLESRGATPDKHIISYCRLSHRATLAYFAMTQLLGYPNVQVYDGSWTEWGSLVGAPIER